MHFLIDYNFTNPPGGPGPSPSPSPGASPTPTSLPDGGPAITACDDGTTTQSGTNNCITGQWARQGGTLAGLIDTTGLCSSSHCVVLNYGINSPYSNAYITETARTVYNIPTSNPFAQTADICHATDGNITYTMTLNGGVVTVNTVVPVPVGGAGNCNVGGGTGGLVCQASACVWDPTAVGNSCSSNNDCTILP